MGQSKGLGYFFPKMKRTFFSFLLLLSLLLHFFASYPFLVLFLMRGFSSQKVGARKEGVVLVSLAIKLSFQHPHTYISFTSTEYRAGFSFGWILVGAKFAFYLLFGSRLGLFLFFLGENEASEGSEWVRVFVLRGFLSVSPFERF